MHRRMTRSVKLQCIGSRSSWGACVSGSLLILFAMATTALAQEEIDFQRHIRPILADRCFACHGPDQEHRSGGFRLDQRESALGEADSGEHPIVEGNPDTSELLRRIVTTDTSEIMPPPETNKVVTPEEAELLRRWIAEGAKWEEHWSFAAPVKTDPPEIEQAAWARDDLDRFIAARLEEAKLEPSSEARKETLIRRVTFDLTGLPPTPQEVQEFLADNSENAYEKLVDRLLESPHYGEHMARFWLDAARYGDTHGLHLDNYREMWLYRDWVVRAFNNNMPYDQFTVEQLAGDLLPNPTWDQKVATGFNRCHVTTSEGGSIAEEVYVRNVVDRVVTTGTVFMGLTMDCTRCHDHKYDPLTAGDFYSMFAFFNNIDGNPLDENRHDPAPIIYTEETEIELAELTKKVNETNAQINQRLDEVEYEDPGVDADSQSDQPQEVVWIEDELPGKVNLDGSGEWQWVTEPEPVFSGKRSHKRTSEGQSQHFFTKSDQALTLYEGDVLFTYVYLDPENPPQEIMLQWNDGSWDHRGYWGANKIEFGTDGTPSRHHLGDLPEAGKWHRLEIPIETVSLKAEAKLNGWAFTQFDGTVYWDKAGVVTREGKPRLYHSLEKWLADVQGNKSPTVPEDKGINEILAKETDKRSEDEQKKLRRYFLERVHIGTREEFAALHQVRDDANKQQEKLKDETPTTLVFRETKELKDSHILIRGEYDQKGEKVERAVPGFLPPLPEDAPVNRLGLALWMVSPEHPLTARVAVNRLWYQLFGVGLVKTLEDFGSQGEMPSHPELLDNLAIEFREQGWDTKKMLKRLVMSATYRQSSKLTPELVSRDPENRLLARGPRYRLDAEMLRDQALSLSGLLSTKLGGPSVKPPQPDGLWFAVGYSGSDTVRFKADEGKDKVHRRTLYTFIKRTAPPPQMVTFDAPSRESCIVRRDRTNTPLQALLLLNDPQYVEAAKAMARRVIDEGGSTDDSRLEYLMRLALPGQYNEAMVTELASLLEDNVEHYTNQPEAIKPLLTIGAEVPPEEAMTAQWAAWTIVCNTILNLDVVVTKQ
ncbi:MAG: PSD1 and planctomycete cytochrome C domain-containing protein [Pirellulaceae bacterium]